MIDYIVPLFGMRSFFDFLWCPTFCPNIQISLARQIIRYTCAADAANAAPAKHVILYIIGSNNQLYIYIQIMTDCARNLGAYHSIIVFGAQRLDFYITTYIKKHLLVHTYIVIVSE